MQYALCKMLNDVGHLAFCILHRAKCFMQNAKWDHDWTECTVQNASWSILHNASRQVQNASWSILHNAPRQVQNASWSILQNASCKMQNASWSILHIASCQVQNAKWRWSFNILHHQNMSLYINAGPYVTNSLTQLRATRQCLLQSSWSYQTVLKSAEKWCTLWALRQCTLFCAQWERGSWTINKLFTQFSFSGCRSSVY